MAIVVWSVATVDAHAQASQPAVTLPIAVHSGHVVVDGYIDDQGPFHFVFDSGAVNVLTPQAAQRLGRLARGHVEAEGTGGAQKAGAVKARAVRLDRLTQTNQTFYVLDLPAGIADDAPVDGLIGWEWLQRYPTRIDYAAGTLTFFPDGLPGSAKNVAPSAISFIGNRAQIAGEIDGLDGYFTIDTGSSGSLTLSSPFVIAHDLVAKYHAHTRVMSAMGVGGPVYSYAARADNFRFGNVSVTRPVTFLSQQTSGTSARTTTAGNIGFGVLRKFAITFDYPHAQIYFEPNARWAEPDLADRSGLRIERSGQGFKVVFVAANSPASEAGLKTGDLVLAVDSRPCADLTADDVKLRLKGPIGRPVTLTVEGAKADIILKLADL